MERERYSGRGKKDFCSWLDNCGADVICIQETKAKPDQLSDNLTNPPKYKSFWASAVKPGYSGTAIYSKTEPDKIEILGDSRSVMISAFVVITILPINQSI